VKTSHPAANLTDLAVKHFGPLPVTVFQSDVLLRHLILCGNGGLLLLAATGGKQSLVRGNQKTDWIVPAADVRR
jgi:hypothetical protein